MGNFALPNINSIISSWDTCREQFATKFNEDISGFYFSHKENKGYDIANFIHRFENIIKSSHDERKIQHSEFAFTSSPFVLFVQVSPFWKECYYRRSLFTILLRCGNNYDCQINNFDECLFSPELKEATYILETKSAIIRFMFGFTRFIGTIPTSTSSTVYKHGWKEEFKNHDDITIKKKLVLPDDVVGCINMIGIDSLWA